MKKNLWKILIFGIILCLCSMILFACDDDTEEPGKPTEEGTITDPTVPEHVHTYGNWITTKAATCTESGLKKRTCVAGDDEQEEVIPAKGHTVVTDYGVAPTCTTTGLTEGKHCSVCGKILTPQETIEKILHQFTNYISNDNATCFSDGTKTAKCNYCDTTDTITVENSMVDHNYQQGHCIYCQRTIGLAGTYKINRITQLSSEAQETIIISLGETYNNKILVRDYCCFELNNDGTIVFSEDDISYSGIWTADSSKIICSFDTDDHLQISIDIIDSSLSIPQNEDSTIIYYFSKDCDNHNYSEWLTIESSVCNAVSYRVRVCMDCGYVEYENGFDSSTIHPHDLRLVTKEPTCTEKGINYRFQCKNCGTIVAEQLTPALGHNLSGVQYTYDDYYHYQKCRRCGRNVISSHQCDTWNTVKESTCTEQGLQSGVCQYCGKNLEQTIPLKNHQWNMGTQTVAPTCIEEGNMQYSCIVCSTIKNVPITKTGHTYNSGTITKEPTCTQYGIKTYECTYCHHTDNREIAPLGHDWDTNDGSITTEPDCYHQGIFTYHCTRCDATNTRYVPIKHSFDSGTVTTAATCTATGVMRFTCTICSVTADKAIPPAHSITHKNKINPTCTDDGSKAHDYCTACGKYFAEITSEKEYLEYENRTYTNCFVRSYSYTEISLSNLIIPAFGHDFANKLSYDATSHWYVCQNGCGAKKDEALHSLSDVYDYSVEPSGGSVYIYKVVCHHNQCSTCGYCQKTTSENADTWTISHEHNTYEAIPPVAPTCETPGYAAGCRCAICNEIVYEQEEIEPLGHNMIDSVCTRCGLNLIFEINEEETEYSLVGVADKNITILTVPSLHNGLPVTEIKEATFNNCSQLKTLRIPNSIRKIGEGALSDCFSLVELTIPFVGNRYDVTSTDTYQYPFGYIFGTSSYNSGRSTTQYYYGSSTSSTTSTTYYIPYSLKSVTVTGGNILYGAFYNCSRLTSITIPDSVTSIGYSAFYGCVGLTSITFGENSQLTSIGGSAFYGCSSLTSITIPDSVTSIGSSAFSGCSSLTSITIPDSVTSIGNFAFEYCSSLTSITIPDSVTSIGRSAFRVCSSLTSITIPDSVMNIDFGTLSGCSGLTSITIPDKVTSIGNYAFSGCSSLTSVTIPGSVMSIGNSAFRGCSSLTSVTIPDSVRSIGDGAFEGCSSLTSVTIGNGVTSIGNQAFSGCSGLTSINVNSENTVYASENGVLFDKAKTTLICCPVGKTGAYSIPSGVTSIGDYAFYGCSGLTSITFGENSKLTSIRIAAFSGCTGLTSITIPDSVASIGSFAFSDCSSLTSVTIPDSVTSIGDYAFFGCSGLTSITFGENSKLTSIRRAAFYGCRSLTSITIPDSVTSIEQVAFEGCYKLVEIYNKSSLNITKGSTDNGLVGYYAKGVYTAPYTSKLSTDENGYILYTDEEEIILMSYIGTNTQLALPNGVSEIKQYAFEGCSGLTSITIPDSVASIGSAAFSGCSSLTSITIPFVGSSKTATEASSSTSFGYIFGTKSYTGGTITRQYYSEYYIPSSLKNVTITGGNILYCAFYNCSGLTSITIPDSVTSIGDRAFYGCSGLTSITLPDSMTSIGEHAFYDCSSLTSITIPDGVTSIGESAFCDCSGLTSITIPDSVTSIGSSAFARCSGLTSITIPNSVTSIGNYAFWDCSGLTSITIGSGVTSIGSGAFNYCHKLVEVYNKSSLSITKGSYDYGQVGYYAKGVYTAPYTSKLSTDENGYILYTDGDDIILMGYTGTNTTLTLPSGITTIYQYAFYNCSGLTSITFGENSQLTSIGNDAFCYCTGLTSITIPDSVTSIGSYAFSNCSKLTSISFNGDTWRWSAISKGYSWNLNTGNYTVHCTDGDIKK